VPGPWRWERHSIPYRWVSPLPSTHDSTSVTESSSATRRNHTTTIEMTNSGNDPPSSRLDLLRPLSCATDITQSTIEPGVCQVTSVAATESSKLTETCSRILNLMMTMIFIRMLPPISFPTSLLISGSETQSITPSIYEHQVKYGRTYHSFRAGGKHCALKIFV
jgi:hypothetical protein